MSGDERPPVAVIDVLCRKCYAKPGERCRRRNSHPGQAHRTHAWRIEDFAKVAPKVARQAEIDRGNS